MIQMRQMSQAGEKQTLHGTSMMLTCPKGRQGGGYVEEDENVGSKSQD